MKLATLIIVTLSFHTNIMGFDFSNAEQDAKKSVGKELEKILTGKGGRNNISGYLENLLSLDTGMDFGLFEGLLNIECENDINIPDIGNLCDKLNPFGRRKSYLDFQIGGCSIEVSNDLEKSLNTSIDSFCNGIAKDVTKALDPSVEKELAEVEGAIIGNNVLNNENIINQDTKTLDIKYPSKETTESLYGEGGSLTHREMIVKGTPALQEEMRDVANFKSNLAYRMIEKEAKVKKYSSKEKLYKVINKPNLPFDTGEDYQKQTVQQAINITNERHTEGEYLNKISLEISNLKKDSNYKYNLTGSSSDMKKNYLQTNQNILDAIMDKSKGSNTAYAKAVRDITLQNSYEYSNTKETRLDNGFLINPSNKKLNLLPVQDRLLYSHRAKQQQKIEVQEIVNSNRILKERLSKLKLLTQRAFYNSLEYQPIIIQTRINEILEAGK